MIPHQYWLSLLCGSVLAFAVNASAAAADSANYILTPKPGLAPHLNGPKVYGARSAHPFLYRIPCTGERPIKFTATGLPPSLVLDSTTGIVTGRTPQKAGEYGVTLEAVNGKGNSTRRLKIVVGDVLALTPPMGWNDWYTHYDRITDTLMRQAADAMISSGLSDFGYQYVNIDDAWMVKPGAKDADLGGQPRDADGAIRPNGRFPDMKALTDYIHSKGLKAGIYTSPGPRTCADFEGSYKHEDTDARKFAAWGFDLLKYDWCSYQDVAPNDSLAELKKPYTLMGGILKALDRDVVFNLCQYGMGEVWKWGAEVGGNSWRTTGDLGLEKETRLPGFYSIAFKNAEHSAEAGPGHWNDPDYILIGSVGNAFKIDEPPKPTSLTADEQYSYMSLWAMMAAPLFFSGDMGHLDEFTLNILGNSEIIDVDQDPLGQQAAIVRHTPDELILARPLEDGSVALALFNLTNAPRTITVAWDQLHITGPRRLRDLWRQRDLNRVDREYSTRVRPHGVMMVRLAR